jgi:hypothetical protein
MLEIDIANIRRTKVCLRTPILDQKQPHDNNNDDDDDDDNGFILVVKPKISHTHTTRTRAISPSGSSLTAGSMSIGTLSSGRTRSKSPKVPMKSDTR